MEVRVSNRLWMRLDDLSIPVANELRVKFEHNNPEYHKKRQQGFGVGSETPVITTWKHTTIDDGYCHRTWLTLPRGGTQRLREVCAAHSIPIEWVDQMTRGNVLKCGGEYTGDWVSPQMFPNRRQVPWEHQERMVKAILAKHQGVARAPTGSGKTSALIDAIRQANVPAIVIVWESGLLEQWQSDLLCSHPTGIDPMWTVMNEGGPWHVRGHLQAYLARLRETGRAGVAERIASAHPGE